MILVKIVFGRPHQWPVLVSLLKGLADFFLEFLAELTVRLGLFAVK